MIFKSRIGKHYYKMPLRNILSLIPTKRKEFSYKFDIDSRAWYVHDTNHHTNKICGIRWGYEPFNNSVRIGWRPSSFKGLPCFQIMLYSYVNGKRVYSPVTKIMYGQKCSIEMEINDKALDKRFEYNTMYQMAVNIKFTVHKQNEEDYECIKSVVFDEKPNTEWIFQEQPYFGGKQTAITNHYINLIRK